MDQSEFTPEFSREPVAVLVAAIVGSLIDPMDADLPERPLLHPQQPGEAPPAVEAVAGRLASLLVHYEARVEALQAHGMPSRLANEYQELKLLLIETTAFQLRTVHPGGEQTQH